VGEVDSAGDKLGAQELPLTARLPRVSLPLFEETYTVSRLGAEVRDFLGEAFRGVWVAGEVQRPTLRGGHLYFDLVEKGAGDKIVGKLEAVLWRSDAERLRRVLASTGQAIADGLAIRCRADLDFYPPQGRLRLRVRDVDPVFTEGELARRRRETLLWLAEHGLLEHNRSLALPELPLRLGLVTSHGSAAQADFLATLRESGYGFQVIFVHAAVQGPMAEREVASALRALHAAGVDCAVLVRGGGSRADLAAFDSRAIAAAVARAAFPVLTGLGHEIDESVADRAAHAAFKTPTKAAEFLVERVAAAERRLEKARADLLREAADPLQRGRQRLEELARALRAVHARVRHARSRLAGLERGLDAVARARLRHAQAEETGLRRRLRNAARRAVESAAAAPERGARRIADLARGTLGIAGARLEGGAARARLLDPQRTLERGYSITRRADGGVLRAARQAAPGERILTRLSDGILRSVVEES
jgi:exodeoxyribonuclease VII large subunit